MNSLVSYSYQKGLINEDDLSIDSSTVPAKKGGQQKIGYDGYKKKTKGSKVHTVATTLTSLPVSIDLGPGNEHESRRLFPLLKNIKIRGPEDQGTTDQSGFTLITSIILSVGDDVPCRRGIAAHIKERVNSRRRQGRLHFFNYEMYTKIRSCIERFFAWMKSFRGFRLGMIDRCQRIWVFAARLHLDIDEEGFQMSSITRTFFVGLNLDRLFFHQLCLT